MRFFSRIGSWLRARGALSADAPARASERTVLDAETLRRLPRASADTFRDRFLTVLRAAANDVQVAQLDPSVRVLVLARHGQSSDERIDAALREIESGAQALSSVTWSALRDARPPFRPAPADWTPADVAPHIEGDAGILFFVDVEAIALAVQQAVESLGLTAVLDDDGTVVRVSDGRFVAHIGCGAIVAEALWTGVGPLSVLLRRVQLVPAELRSFVALLRGLERRFVGRRFEVIGDRLVVRGAGDVAHIDYRQLAAAVRSGGLGVDAFLAGARLEDLIEQSGDVAMLVRAPSYRKAWPDVVCADVDGALLVAVREEHGRTRPIRRHPDDPPGRFTFLEREALRQLPFTRIDGHAFVVERAHTPGARAGARACVLVGDKAATLLLHPSLVRGFLEQLGPVPERAFVETLSENVVVVSVADAALADDDAILVEARRRAARLEGDLFDDGADPLEVKRVIELPAVGAGIFDLTLVPDEFFLLSDQALQSGDLGRAHGDYLRGLAFESLGLTDKAVRAFEKAARARADDGEINLALGRTLSARGDHERAVSVLERAAGVLPEHAEVQNALGVALYKSGAAGDARLAFLKAVKLSPDEVGFLVNLGRTCCDERLFGEARSALERALRLEPSSAEAHASMAVLCHRTGERQRALHHARAALAERPDDDTVRELLRMLDEGDGGF